MALGNSSHGRQRVRHDDHVPRDAMQRLKVQALVGDHEAARLPHEGRHQDSGAVKERSLAEINQPAAVKDSRVHSSLLCRLWEDCLFLC